MKLKIDTENLKDGAGQGVSALASKIMDCLKLTPDKMSEEVETNNERLRASLLIKQSLVINHLIYIQIRKRIRKEVEIS